jgi:hypothetical protein
MKTVLGVILLGLAMALVVSPWRAVAQPNDATSITEALLAAQNSNDVDGGLALFAEDAVVQTPAGRFKGSAEIGPWLASFGNVHFQGEVVQTLVATGSLAVQTQSNMNDIFRRLGVAPVYFVVAVSVRDGKITSFTADFTPESAAKVQAARAAAQAQPTPAPAAP